MRKQPASITEQFSKRVSIKSKTTRLSIGTGIKHGFLRSSLALALMGSGMVSAETIHINSRCSLINAINAANQDAAVAGCRAGNGKDRLVLPQKQFLFSSASEQASALPVITSEIVIEGHNTVVNRHKKADNFRFFYVDHSAQLTLKQLTLKGGKQGPGGAVFVQYGGKLELRDSVLTENSSVSGKGGAIEARGDVAISRSVISHNAAGFSGAGIHMTEGSLILDSSTVSHNRADGVEGGAGITILGHAESHIINSTISANSAIAGSGGGLRIRTSYPGEVSITNSTIATNKALKTGGGIHSSGDLQLSHSIVSGNQALSAVEISATGYNVANDYNVFGQNGNAGLSGMTLFGGDLVPDQALEKIIGPLTDNGGKTPTHALVAGSPAINAGGLGFKRPSTDQRGVPRPQGKRVDIGAVEAVNIPLTSDVNDTIFADGINCSLRDAITAALTDQQTGGCTAGAGTHDTIALKGAEVYQINNTLPTIKSYSSPTGGQHITIEGNGATITASPEQAPMQFFHVQGAAAAEIDTPVLRLKNLTLSGAVTSAVSSIRAQVYLSHTTIRDSGVGVIVDQDADLFSNASTIANNVAGILTRSNALLVITNSTISGNNWPGIIVGPLTQFSMKDSTISANGGRGLILNSRYYQPKMSRNLIAGNGRKLGENKNREILQKQTALPWTGGLNIIGYNGKSGAANSVMAMTDTVPTVALDNILMPLDGNEGLTETHALPVDSPAIDAAGLECATQDQRGINRPQANGCDVGAYEALAR